MSVRLPEGMRWERLAKSHPRKAFTSGQSEVDDWLKTKALQHQDKHLSATKVLLADPSEIVGYYTLASGQIDFGDLPIEIARTLPKRALPIAKLAWLGVSSKYQGQGFGRTLLAQSIGDAYTVGQTFAFVALIVDCIDEVAKQFYLKFGFFELPGFSNRVYLRAMHLESIVLGTIQS